MNDSGRFIWIGPKRAWIGKLSDGSWTATFDDLCRGAGLTETDALRDLAHNFLWFREQILDEVFRLFEAAK